MIKPDKGKKNGSCNRAACQAPNAKYLNTAKNAYYCLDCAAEIEAVARREGYSFHDDEVVQSRAALRN